jgi:hypothetical protein
VTTRHPRPVRHLPTVAAPGRVAALLAFALVGSVLSAALHAQAPANLVGKVCRMERINFGISVIATTMVHFRGDGTFVGIYRTNTLAAGAQTPLDGTYTYVTSGANTATLTTTYAGSPAQVDTLTFDSAAAGGFAATGSTGTFSLSDFPGAAALLNTSERCWISPDQPAIIGFVVPLGKTALVLVRAVGPGLAAFPGTTPAADPRLEFYRDSTLLATNDDWEVDPATGAGSATSIHVRDAAAVLGTFVGAFPLATGARDAAHVREVGPGIYTVHVRVPAGAARGEVLGEVYVVPQ